MHTHHKSKLLGDIAGKTPGKKQIELFGKKEIFGMRPIDVARTRAGFDISKIDNPVNDGQLAYSGYCRRTPRNGDFDVS